MYPSNAVKRMAEVFLEMQRARHDLLSMAEANGFHTKSGKVALMLANLCDDAKDAIKEKFEKVTLMEDLVKVQTSRKGLRNVHLRAVTSEKDI